MASRPTLDDAQSAARELLVMAARDATGEEMAAVLVRLGGSTRKGQVDANLLLAEVFAGILEDECPVIWCTTEGVPDVHALAEIAHDPGEAHRYVALKVADGQELSLAEAKARIARRSSATDLSMLYLRYRRLDPEQLAAFIDDASKQTPVMADHVWGSLWVACATVRAMAAYRAAIEAID